ncbi:DUF2304 domain-containing protein [Streptococcus pacificus]|uniref:DUF2304 domain-containing protein n=1 Tax=Streptococcus pacificus TaxID=2740577 RepID=A0ABS0ZH57_9STRE|nr:DUF2304 domain-containing protein [Streptococcus pacificus]MBJ8325327.1 DUF2304 domain-containing protein [Streptococcus pacificus]
MSSIARIFVSILIFSFIVWVIKLIKHDKLAIRYSLSWFILAFFILIFAWFPNFLKFISNLLGIYSPTNMLFFFGFCLSLMIIFSLTNNISIQNHKLKHLAQEIALLKKEEGNE